jgi:hypothetical protein
MNIKIMEIIGVDRLLLTTAVTACLPMALPVGPQPLL